MRKFFNSEVFQVGLLLVSFFLGVFYAMVPDRQIILNESSRSLLSTAAEFDGDIYMKRYLYNIDGLIFDSLPPFDRFINVAYVEDAAKATGLAKHEFANHPEILIYLFYIVSHQFQIGDFQIEPFDFKKFKGADAWFSRALRSIILASQDKVAQAFSVLDFMPPEPFVSANIQQRFIISLLADDKKAQEKYAALLEKEGADFLSLKLLVDFHLRNDNAEKAKDLVASRFEQNKNTFVYLSFKNAIDNGTYKPGDKMTPKRALALLIYTYTFAAYAPNREDGELYAVLMNQVLALDPSFDFARIGLIGAYSSLGDRQGVEKTLAELDSSSFLYSFAILQNAKFLASRGQHRKAARALTNLPKDDFGVGNAEIMLGDIALERNNFTAARRHYESAVDKTVGIFKADAMYKLMSLDEFENRQREDRLATLEKILELDPQNRTYMAEYAIELATTGERKDQDRALLLASRLLTHSPGSSHALYTMGYIMRVRGDLEEAEGFLKLAYSREPENWVIQDLLAETFALQGRIEAAITLWTATLNNPDPSLPLHKRQEIRQNIMHATRHTSPID
ncbi:MAG: hypothetical protein FWD15_00720 [Alphaproteobacteria bacterium]|nr:hypothetical protein [Alphaproteobacteria bacterium]